MNFSGISRAGILGRLLRLPLGLIPGGMVVRILQGKLRGYRWIATASTHGCWIGSYEMAKQTQFVAALKKGSVVYDVGANVGFYSLLASACVGPAGRVFAFEPLTANALLLERHAQINHLTNITIHPFAVSDHSGKMRFKRGGNCETGKLSADGEIEVAVVSLDDYVYGLQNHPPNMLKIDVEGAEVEVLQGAPRLLRQNPPIVFLATHSPKLHQECHELLSSAGYKIDAIDEKPPQMTDEVICIPRSR